MEKITIFKTNMSVKIIDELLISNSNSPLCTKDRCLGEPLTPKKLAKFVKNYGDRYLVYGKKKTVWVHKCPENLAKLLIANKVSFTVKCLDC